MNGEFSLDDVSNKVGQVIRRNESDLKSTLYSANKETSATDLLNMQLKLQSWSVSVQMQSSIVKELGDALKGVVQKSN
ncbi:MAG: hypothetical protein RIR70_1769 [Pseudomonadota bacterium]|jgi:type III secretion protein F